MKMKIEFTLDNDAFGDNHDDSQFGYAIQTALRRIGDSYAGLSRRDVGETGDGDHTVWDSNGNNVGTIVFEGYEPPVLSKTEKLENMFREEALTDILEALHAERPDYKITVGMALHDNELFTQLDGDPKITTELVDELLRRV